MSPLKGSKGIVSNPDGRPLLGDAPRVMISARVAPETRETLVEEAAAEEKSLGLLLDDVADRMRANRKRRKKRPT